uniref:Uncharacterized protein n=1 Tax=Cacopsylla melanoneura TaxID=428564 RepID=A0A8D8RUZ8_9HEMI
MKIFHRSLKHRSFFVCIALVVLILDDIKLYTYIYCNYTMYLLFLFTCFILYTYLPNNKVDYECFFLYTITNFDFFFSFSVTSRDIHIPHSMKTYSQGATIYRVILYLCSPDFSPYNPCNKLK